MRRFVVGPIHSDELIVRGRGDCIAFSNALTTIMIGDLMSTSLESYEEALEAAGDFADNGNKKDRARVAIVAAQVGELSEVDGAARPEAMRRIGMLCRALAGVPER